MADEIVIKVDGVYKDFILPHEKVGSVKGIFTSMFRKVTIKNESQHALKDISFEIKKGEFFGIVGRNGSGKSTLLKILAGIYQPTKGSVNTQGKLVPFIELGVGFNPELSGRDNVYLNGAILGFSVKEVESMYNEIVAFAELEKFMDQKLKNYSSGMQVRLAFSMATRAEAEILLVDEVLAVGDADFQRKCFDYFKQLKRLKKTVVFVTHDMNAIREYCDRALLIEDSKMVAIDRSDKVATAYSKMFIDEVIEDKAIGDDTSTSRWGNKKVSIQKVTTSVKDNKIKVLATAKANKTVGQFLYGIHIIGPDGKEITATNNRLISQPDIKGAKQGEIIEFEWDIMNIFNDGKYGITLTMVSTNGDVFDWYENVSSFRILREERSTTAVLPPMSVKTSIMSKEK